MRVSMGAYALIVKAEDRLVEEERIWCEFVRLMRIEDGSRWVLDNEMHLHDAVLSGQMTLAAVASTAKDRFVGMVSKTPATG